MGRWSILKEEDKDGSASGQNPKKGRLAFSVRFPEDHQTCDYYLVIVPDPDFPIDKEGLAWLRYMQKWKEKGSLSKEARDDLLRKKFGSSPKIKGHPKMWAVHEFVENVRVLKVEKVSRIRKMCREEKEKYCDELLEYIREALENLDWKGLQGLVRILEKAVTEGGDLPYESSDLVNAHRAMKKYDEKKLADIIAEGDWQPDENGVILFPLELMVIPHPTLADLLEFFPESEHRRKEQIRRAVKALGHTMRPGKPGVPPR